jgi:hypothetical protein
MTFMRLSCSSVLGQRRQHDVAGQLPEEILHRPQREVVLLHRAEIDLALGGRKRDGLRPDPVLSAGRGGKVVAAGVVGQHRWW